MEKDVEERQDAGEWVSDVKFSPNGRWLAVGSHDSRIYLYAVDASDGLKISISKRKVRRNCVVLGIVPRALACALD